MCNCGSEEKKNVLLPQVGVITDIRQETPDVKTFRIVKPDGTKLFDHMPGQCGMLCVPGVGEGMFSITSSGRLKISVLMRCKMYRGVDSTR